jgi:hypothetical protein
VTKHYLREETYKLSFMIARLLARLSLIWLLFMVHRLRVIIVGTERLILWTVIFLFCVSRAKKRVEKSHGGAFVNKSCLCIWNQQIWLKDHVALCSIWNRWIFPAIEVPAVMAWKEVKEKTNKNICSCYRFTHRRYRPTFRNRNISFEIAQTSINPAIVWCDST